MNDIVINSLEEFDELVRQLQGRRRMQEHIIKALVEHQADTRHAVTVRNDISCEIYRLTQIRRALEVDEPPSIICTSE